jgi:hypothetical protein
VADRFWSDDDTRETARRFPSQDNSRQILEDGLEEMLRQEAKLGNALACADLLTVRGTPHGLSSTMMGVAAMAHCGSRCSACNRTYLVGIRGAAGWGLTVGATQANPIFDVNGVDDKGIAALHIAAFCGHTEVRPPPPPLCPHPFPAPGADAAGPAGGRGAAAARRQRQPEMQGRDPALLRHLLQQDADSAPPIARGL